MKLQIRLGALFLILWFVNAFAPAMKFKELFPISSYPMFSEGTGPIFGEVYLEVYAKGEQTPIRCSETEGLYPLEPKGANMSIADAAARLSVDRYLSLVKSTVPRDVFMRDSIASMWRNSAKRALKPGSQVGRIDVITETFNLNNWPPSKLKKTVLATIAF